MGAMIPKIRFAVEARPFPVPRSFVGKSCRRNLIQSRYTRRRYLTSGVIAYSTPYIMLLVKVYPQFQPRSPSLVRAVVPAKRNTPVRTVQPEHIIIDHTNNALGRRHSLVEIDNAPFLPMYGRSTAQPPTKAPGMPSTLRITWFRYVM